MKITKTNAPQLIEEISNFYTESILAKNYDVSEIKRDEVKMVVLGQDFHICFSLTYTSVFSLGVSPVKVLLHEAEKQEFTEHMRKLWEVHNLENKMKQRSKLDKEIKELQEVKND